MNAPSLVPEGKYVSKVVSGGFDVTSAKSTPYIWLKFDVTDGDGSPLGSVKWEGWLTDKNMPRVAEALVLLGYNGSNPEDDFQHGDATELCPAEVSIEVEHEVYNEKTRARVAFIKRPPGKVDPAKAATMKSGMAAALAAARATAANGPQAVAPTGPNLPF